MSPATRSPSPVNKPMAFFCCRTEVTEIHPRPGPAVALPRRLVIPPGRYRAHGRTYALTREGLYRFLFPGTGNQQRIVYRRNIPALLSAVAWLQTHGKRDVDKNFQALKTQALKEKLIITCGYISSFGCQLLTELGIPCRRVNSLSLQELNTYDNGHSLVEVKLNERWILVDLDMGFLFRSGGKRLALLDAAHAVRLNRYDLEPLCAAAPFSVCCFRAENKPSGYDYGLWIETMLHSPACVRRWYRRILMVPYIDKYITVERASDTAKARRLWPQYNLIAPKEFIRKYYS